MKAILLVSSCVAAVGAMPLSLRAQAPRARKTPPVVTTPADTSITAGSAAPPIARRVVRPATRPVAAPVTAMAATSGRTRTLAFPPADAEFTRDPLLGCAVLRACVIDLEPGERLLGGGPIIGDAVRWRLGTAPTGANGASTVVWVKPTDCGLATNLVLPTDRRVYHLALDSGRCDGAAVGGGEYTSRLRFTYPADPAHASTARTSSAHSPAGVPGDLPTRLAAIGGAAAPERPAIVGIPVDAMRLNFAYAVRRDRHFPWAPAHVFDDGGHTFIQLPPEADAHAAPALFELDDAGAKSLLNYVVRDGYYVTDRTFRRAALVVGQGKHEQRIDLVNQAFSRVPRSGTTDASGGRP